MQEIIEKLDLIIRNQEEIKHLINVKKMEGEGFDKIMELAKSIAPEVMKNMGDKTNGN